MCNAFAFTPEIFFLQFIGRRNKMLEFIFSVVIFALVTVQQNAGRCNLRYLFIFFLEVVYEFLECLHGEYEIKIYEYQFSAILNVKIQPQSWTSK